MKVFKGMIPYLGGIIAAFYLLPLCMRDTGGAMLTLLFAMPASFAWAFLLPTAGGGASTRSILWR